jgi:hypothetical protein
MTSPLSRERGSHWIPASIIVTTLVISIARAIASPTWGSLPALAPLDAVKFIDPVLVLAVGILAVISTIGRRARVYPSWKVRWAVAASVILSIGVMSTLFSGAPGYFAAQSVWFVLRPAVLLLVLTGSGWNGRIKPWLIVVLVAFVLANAAVAIEQWLVLRASGPDFDADGIIGLFHDAHQQATFGYSAALLSLAAVAAAITVPRRLAWLSLAGLCVFVGFISQGQKATGIEAAILAGAIAVLVLRSRSLITRAVVGLPAFGLMALLLFVANAGVGSWTVAKELITGNLENRLVGGGYQGLTFVRDLGVVQMFADFGSLSAANPAVLVLGVGPSNYGSPAALTRVDRGKASASTRELFWWESLKEPELVAIGQLRLLGLSSKTSLLGVLLGEYGCIAFLAFLYLLLWPLFIQAPAHEHSAAGLDWGSPLFWLKAAYLGLILQAAITTIGAWDNDVVLTMLIVGFASVLVDREESSVPATLLPVLLTDPEPGSHS